ncbi:ROK family protein [Streptacidiphilus monticola]
MLALDLGARHLRGAVADLEGHILLRRDAPVEGLNAAQMVDVARKLAEELTTEAGLDRLAHAAVGVPGVVDRREGGDGRIWQALNIPGLDGFQAAEQFSRALGVPVTVENDIHLAALGEQHRGCGREVESFCFLSVGTGTGAGLVLDGRLHRGFAGAAGELDCALDPDAVEEQDPCADALLAYASRLLPEALSLGTEGLFDLARSGDEKALAVVDEEARRVAGYLAPVAAVADVELVVLGGGSASTATSCWVASANAWTPACRTRPGSRSRPSATRRSSPGRSPWPRDRPSNRSCPPASTAPPTTAPDLPHSGAGGPSAARPPEARGTARETNHPGRSDP